MENSLRPQEPYFRRRSRGRSYPATQSESTLGLLKRTRSRSAEDVQVNTTYDTQRSSSSLELLYTITDIVLVICGAVFIISSVTSIVLWMYGLHWRGMEKNRLRVKLGQIN